jgi:hypothetical protein
MAQNSIEKVKKIISEIVTNRWNDTKIKDKGNALVYDIQHKYEKVSYSATFEMKDNVINIEFRSKPYDQKTFVVDRDAIESLRFAFYRTCRKGITGESMEFENSRNADGVIPVIYFKYWICQDIKEDTLKETLKTLMEVVVPGDCIQLIKFLRNEPAYLA